MPNFTKSLADQYGGTEPFPTGQRSPLAPKREAQEPYPIDALGPILGPAASAMVSGLQVRPALAAQCLLGSASFVAMRFANVSPPHGGGDVILSLFLTTIAASGERKSTANRVAMAPIEKYQRLLAEQRELQMEYYQKEKAYYDAVFAKAKRAAVKRSRYDEIMAGLKDEPLCPLSAQIILREPSVEAILDSAENAEACRGLFNDEAAGWLGGYAMSADKIMGTLGHISKIWDGDSISQLRVSRDTPPVTDQRMALHLMGQEVVFGPLLSNELAREQGFLARILLVEAEPLAGTRKVGHTYTRKEKADIEAMQDHLYDLLVSRPVAMLQGKRNKLAPYKLTLSPEAMQVFREFEAEIEAAQAKGRKYELIKGWASKACEQALRLAGIFTVIENAENQREIDMKTMIRGVTLARFYVNEYRRLVASAIARPEIAKAQVLLNWFLEKRGTYIYRADIIQYGPSGCRSVSEIKPILDTLEKYGQIEAVQDRVINGKLRSNCYCVLN